jgi:hypothetical protein
MAKLSLCGIPLETISDFTVNDTLSPAYILSRKVYDIIKKTRSVAESDKEIIDEKSPAPYLKNIIETILLKDLDEDSSKLINEMEIRTELQIFLTLFEVFLNIFTNYQENNEVVTIDQSFLLDKKFAIRLKKQPDWLVQATFKSFIRKLLVVLEKDERINNKDVDPVVYFSNELEYFKTILPHGNYEQLKNELYHSLLAQASTSKRIKLPLVLTSTKLQKPIVEESWLETFTERLVGILNLNKENVEIHNEIPLSSVKNQILRQYAIGSNPPVDEIAVNSFIINSSNIISILSSIDVMQSYEHQSI